MPYMVFLKGEALPKGIGRLATFAPRWRALMRSVFAMAGTSCFAVFVEWHIRQRIWRLSGVSDPPSASGMMWSMSHPFPGAIGRVQDAQRPLAWRNRSSRARVESERRGGIWTSLCLKVMTDEAGQSFNRKCRLNFVVQRMWLRPKVLKLGVALISR